MNAHKFTDYCFLLYILKHYFEKAQIYLDQFTKLKLINQ